MRFYNRQHTILDLCRKKHVLHLGCVGFADLRPEKRIQLSKQSLHYQLTHVAYTTGIDYCQEAIDFFKTNGVFENILFGNVEKLDHVELNETFDVILAGDIVEHLSNPGLMLDGVKRFCRPGTLLIITTPNAFGIINFFRYVLGVFREGLEHVLMFNSQNIQHLLERHQFTIQSIDTCHQERSRYGLGARLAQTFLKCFPHLGGTLFVVACPLNPAIDKQGS